MDVSQDLLIPALLIAFVINIITLVVIAVTARSADRRSLATSRVLASSSLSSASVGAREDRGSSDREAAMALAASEMGDTHDTEVTALQTPMPTGGAPDTTASEAAADLVASTAAEAASPDADVTPATEPEAEPPAGIETAATWARVISAEDARVRRYRRPATVVVMELDGLDRFVERLGSEAADRVLPAVADTIHRLARSADIVARLGPGRFAILLPETDEVAAINYVERVRQACELWLEAGAISLRLVVGWAGTTGDTSLPDTQRAATDRMYAELHRNARRQSGAGSPSDPAPAAPA